MTAKANDELRNAAEKAGLLEREPQPWPFKHWYMVVVRPNHEQDAADSFRRNGVRAYWPNYEKLVPGRRLRNGCRDRRMMLAGIIPGYVFSPGSPYEGFEEVIERVTGVLNIARTFSGEPLFLREEDIQIIRRIEAVLNTPQPVKAIHNFKTGELVRFTDDLTSRWPPGKVGRLAHDGRISVEVDLMGRKVAVMVFPHQIERT